MKSKIFNILKACIWTEQLIGFMSQIQATSQNLGRSSFNTGYSSHTCDKHKITFSFNDVVQDKILFKVEKDQSWFPGKRDQSSPGCNLFSGSWRVWSSLNISFTENTEHRPLRAQTEAQFLQPACLIVNDSKLKGFLHSYAGYTHWNNT